MSQLLSTRQMIILSVEILERGTIRIVVAVGDREFKRLFHRGYKPQWLEWEKFVSKDEDDQLESIFQALQDNRVLLDKEN